METPEYVNNKRLCTWVEEMVALCKPDDVYWCDGSQQEYDALCEQMVVAGTFIRKVGLPFRAASASAARRSWSQVVVQMTTEACSASAVPRQARVNGHTPALDGRAWIAVAGTIR